MPPVIMTKRTPITITLDIWPEIEAELTATERVRGLSAEQYARQVLEQALASATARRPLAVRIRAVETVRRDSLRPRRAYIISQMNPTPRGVPYLRQQGSDALGPPGDGLISQFSEESI